MSRIPLFLVRQHLRTHWARTGLTGAALAVALFLFCFLISLLTTVAAAVNESAGNRVAVQSAVSLFVDLPLDYQGKIQALPGVDQITKFQWFGGYYQDRSNYFAQFGVDAAIFFDQYERDIEIIEGPIRAADGAAMEPRQAVMGAFAADRRAAVIGEGLARDFAWKVGDTVPLQATIYPKEDGSAWEFNVVGIYRPRKSNVDERTLWYRYDYLEEVLDAGSATGPLGTACYMVNLVAGYEPSEVISEIDALFEHGPQRTISSTEAAFQAGFVSMMGNLPLFIGTIGGAVVFAVFFSVVNTMLMAARQRVREAGIMKALGFSDVALAGLMLTESLLLSLLGGGAGCTLAYLAAKPVQEIMSRNMSAFAGFSVTTATLYWGIGIALAIGLVSGLAPALAMARLKAVDALRSEG